MKPKIYVSGPITGRANLNKEAFEDACNILKDKGYDPINPHEVCSKLNPLDRWEVFMKHDLIAMLENPFNIIVMLEGWHKSKDACLERVVALELGYKIYTSVDAVPDRVNRKDIGGGI